MDFISRFEKLLCAAVLIAYRIASAEAAEPWATTEWADAHATFYGGADASGTMGGACGYENLYDLGIGTASTALSNALFNNGLTCGACYELVCNLEGSTWCYHGKSITVTATNACPPGSTGGWCDPPKLHFDLSQPMFEHLAQALGGVIPVRYRRVPCARQGGIRVTLLGNAWFNYVRVHNVGGDGDVAAMALKGEHTDWVPMYHNWGQFWSANEYVVGQALSFRVTLGSGQSLEFYNIAPRDWKITQTYEADYNKNFW